MPSTQDVLDLMQQVAAEVITPRFRALSTGEVEQKTPGDYVTVADREAEALITRELTRMFPDAVVVGEEACFTKPSLEFSLPGTRHAFTVDPVDGTRNFVKGSPDHAVMIAELVDGITTRSWIWQPERGDAYVAERGAGVELNGHVLVRDEQPRLPLGATSKDSRHGFVGGGELAPVVESAWSCGIDYPYLLEGKVDYLVYKNVHPWDHLPGALMVTELGGAVRNFRGEDYTAAWTGPGVIAAATPEIAETVQRLWREP
ncbi:inositol monophosphatase family protein [Luteococcus sp. OSA5]|uniref:inositol monophosphatase family protein n=1 Tax=Luteococcus sp. OSA5 TaxID=3401630 RepID=UPI003B42AB8D